MNTLEVVHTMINQITATCGKAPKRLVVPAEMWSQLYIDIYNLGTEYAIQIIRGDFYRLIVNGVDIRVE